MKDCDLLNPFKARFKPNFKELMIGHITINFLVFENAEQIGPPLKKILEEPFLKDLFTLAKYDGIHTFATLHGHLTKCVELNQHKMNKDKAVHLVGHFPR